MQEAKQQEEEKKAMQEAEELREQASTFPAPPMIPPYPFFSFQKRREYARKQKEKLASYQKNFKTEASKIQELMDLGIDPQLLLS